MGSLKEVGFGEGGASLNVVQRYLTRFGYLDAGEQEAVLGSATSNALKNFQRFFGLDVTGVIDRPTIRSVRIERCAVKDWHGSQSLVPCPWPSSIRVLTYAFGNPSNDLSAEKAFNGVRNAVERWNGILRRLGIDLQLEEHASSVADVMVEWLNPDTDMGLEEDEVAHADLPPDCGVVTGRNLPKPVHFYDAKFWTRDQVSGEFHIESVALHEFGHILGLAHAPLTNPGSIMNPNLPSNFIHPGPNSLDFLSLQEVYRNRP